MDIIYTMVIDDFCNFMEPRGMTRARVDEILEGKIGNRETFGADSRAAEAAAVKNQMWGGASY